MLRKHHDLFEAAAPPPDPTPAPVPVPAPPVVDPPPPVPELPPPPPPPTVLNAESRARIVDLCNHAVRTDAGGTGKLATQILVDLGT
jgi:hypothetical protein